MSFFILGLTAFMTISSYLNARFHRWQSCFYKVPEKFFVKNKTILKYFFNPKSRIPKHSAIEHYSFLIGFIVAFFVCLLYWINNITVFFMEDAIGALILFLVTLGIPFIIMAVAIFIDAKMIKYMSINK